MRVSVFLFVPNAESLQGPELCLRVYALLRVLKHAAKGGLDEDEKDGNGT